MTQPNPNPPTPNVMPGAQPGNPPGPQPVSTEPPAPQAQPQTPPPAQSQPNPPAPQANPQQQPPATDGDKPPEGKDWKDYARLWEQRAKGKGWDELQQKASQWDQYEAGQRTQAENDRIAREAAEKRAEMAEQNLLRERVARETGVPPEFLTGTDESAMREAARVALEWRGPTTPQTPPPPATAAVPASEVTSSDKLGHAPNQVQQLTREQFAALSPAERMAAVRAGQCTNIGIGQPKPGRRMGNQLEVSASGSGPVVPGMSPAT
jgi:hypothetical protein